MWLTGLMFHFVHHNLWNKCCCSISVDFPKNSSRLATRLLIERFLHTFWRHNGRCLPNVACEHSHIVAVGDHTAMARRVITYCWEWYSCPLYKWPNFLAGRSSSIDNSYSQMKLNLMLKSVEDTDWAFPENRGKQAKQNLSSTLNGSLQIHEGNSRTEEQVLQSVRQMVTPTSVHRDRGWCTSTSPWHENMEEKGLQRKSEAPRVNC